MKNGLASKILSGGLAVAMAFGAFSPSAFAEKTRLHKVLENNDPVPTVEEVELIVSEHPEWVKEKDDKGFTPLFWAARYGHLEILEYLFKNGADVNCNSKHDWTPVRVAAVSGHLNVVRYLIEERGVDVNCTDKFGATLLHNAAFSGHGEIVEYLVTRVKNINCKDTRGETPLHNAACSGCLDAVKHLVRNGADVNCNSKHDWTPLHEAVCFGHSDVVRYLADNGADLGFKNDNGDTPLKLARKKYLVDSASVLEGKAKIVAYLESLGVKE